MRKLIICLAVLGISQAAPKTELDAKKFLDQASDKLFNLYDTIATEVYTAPNSDEDFESLFQKLTVVQTISQELVEIAEETKKYDPKIIKDPKIKHALERLRKSAKLFVLGEEYFNNLLLSSNALKELSVDKDVEPYQKSTAQTEDEEERLAYFPDITRIFAKSQDPKELQYYWESWRDKNIIWAHIHFSNIVESIQKAANLTEMGILDFWFEQFENPKFLEEMESVMKSLKPFYQQLHSFVRHQLHTKYGDVVIDKDGPIPEHLFQQVIVQAWKNGSVIDSSFPSSDLPNIDESLIHQNYDAMKIIKTANGFYESLGLDSLDDEFWEKRVKPEDEEQGDCKSDIFDITPHVYLKYCKKVDFRKFLQAHGYMGSIHYALQKKQLPYYYFPSYDLEFPVGEAVILSASTHKHLKSVGLLPDVSYKDDVMMNRLFRMGIHTMFNIPVYFVHTKIMTELLAGQIKFEDLNKIYWNLMEEYVGVEPPSDRKEDVIDFPYKFYESIEDNHQTAKFVSEVLGYQLYHALCLKSGQLANNEKLHNCDFYQNKDVGKSLK
ncbi:hypothetical protein ACFFRR_008931 [Megaselia abdita]